MKAFIAILTGLAIAASATLLSSCGSIFTGDGVLLPDVELPIEIGVQYELEEDLWIQVLPADKGGLEVKLVGEGDLGEHIRKIPGGFEITSPLTGLIYRVTEGASGKPRIMIIGGTGKLQPIPAAEVVEEPAEEVVVDL
jgi:hypothetical protein